MPPREARAIRVTQWSTGIKPTWTVSEVRSALALHASGDFSGSAQLVDTMGEDDHLPGELEKRVGGVLGSDFSLDPVEKANKQLSKRLVARYEPLWWDMFPESEMSDLLTWRRMLGVGIGVLDWERGGNEWRARFRSLHPQYLRWDDFERRWIYSAKEGELVVTPGDGTWILLTDGQRGWMKAGVRALAVTWLAKQMTIRDWNRYNERHGLPIIKAKAPAIADDADKDAFWEDVQCLNSEIVAQLPSHLDEHGASFDLELLEAKDGSYESFERNINRADRRFSTYLLGQNLSTEVTQNGSRAATETHRGVERDKCRVDAQHLSTGIRREGLFPIIGFNHAGVTLDVIPWPKWDTEPADENEAQAKAKETFGKAVKSIQDAGYDIENIDELSERYGLKLKRREQAGQASPTGIPGARPEPANDDDDAEDPEPIQEGDEEPARAPAVAASTHRLRSGASAAANPGFLSGQLYADAVVERATTLGRAELEVTISAVLEELEAAEGYDDLRERLRRR